MQSLGWWKTFTTAMVFGWGAATAIPETILRFACLASTRLK